MDAAIKANRCDVIKFLLVEKVKVDYDNFSMVIVKLENE